MIRILLYTITFFFIVPADFYGQQNCNAYLYQNDTIKYKACIASEKRFGHYQFSKAFQIALDDAINIDPTYSPAYRSKCAGYLKSGDFVTWNYLMTQAVKYDPLDNLGDRGWCRFKFFGDYKGAIKDLLELQKLRGGDMNEASGDGYYHLNVVLSLCYKSIGKTKEALAIMKKTLADSTHIVGLFDHLHLGVMYLEFGDFQNAINQFKQQEIINDLAENRFYTAIAYKHLKNKEFYIENLNLSKKMYQIKKRIFDGYVEMVDKIYLSDIISEEKNSL